jgi:hypothetical protein
VSRPQRIALCLLITGVTGFGAEATITQERMAKTNRLVTPVKVTVGPDDQYRGVLDTTGQQLIFTRKSDLVPHLCRQILRTGEVTDWLPLSADSQEAVISPDNLVAFTYFKFSARGDICYRRLSGSIDEKITCLKGDENEHSAPFWKSARELGFVTRDVRTLESKIVVENIDTGAREPLVSGKVWSPAMKPGGHLLFYNQLTGTGDSAQRVFGMKDLTTGQTRTLRFRLPGISGFPAVSEDESYLYFSHYLNDTNNDNIIDGTDNSVVFRVSIDQALATGDVFPEQLTSAENNCSFPRPAAGQLFVTCAFEGNLDIYQIPQTGVVPVGWNAAMLDNAHQTARTYQERVLLLNTLKFRFPALHGNSLQRRLLSDHLFAEGISAARFYLDPSRAKSTEKTLYQLLGLYLDALAAKRAQPTDEISREFLAQILGIDAKIAKISGEPRLQNTVRGLLRVFIHQTREAAQYLAKIHFPPTGDPIERYYAFELASQVLPQLPPKTNSLPSLDAAYRQMILAPELVEESHLYYAFRYLKYLQEKDTDLSTRIQAIQAMARGIQGPAATLLQSELATLTIVAAQGDTAKRKAYAPLNKLLNDVRPDYFLRKAVYVRAILNFSASGDFLFLGFVASTWLNETAQTDTEFTYARDVFINANLDEAYGNFGKQIYQAASDYFYTALRLTDDLESHYGYVQNMVLRGQRSVIESRYQNLVERKIVADNYKYVLAVLRLVDAKPKDRGDTAHLDYATQQLLAMEDRDNAARYLLLGYCYLDKLLRTANGPDFDRELFESAHRYLMLAYDLGRDNQRVKASALVDLGILHQRVQNHGLAVKFFALRKKLGFAPGDERARFAALYARSLYYIEQADTAAQEIGEAMADPRCPPALRVPLQARRAFYLVASSQFAPAAEAYQQLWKTGAVSGDRNLASLSLSYGYALFKLKQFPAARAALLQARTSAAKLRDIPASGDSWGDFEPLRIQLITSGLLGQIGTVPERIQALRDRAAILLRTQSYFDDAIALQIQVQLQLAFLEQNGQPQQAASDLRTALALTERLGDSGQYLSHAVYEATVAYLTHGIENPALYAGQDPGRIQKIVDKSVAAYGAQKNPQTVLEEQKHRIQTLWDRFATTVPGAGKAQAGG